MPLIEERDVDRAAPVRLFCLPHAGSGAALFYRWKRLLAPHIQVVPILLPGRESRLAEASFLDFDLAVASIRDALEPYLAVPYALFGHSMGALLASELAMRLRPGPIHLFVSGREAPQVTLGHRHLHQLGDSEFRQELQKRYGGAQDGLLDDAELRAIFLPILRSDITLVESYQDTGHRCAVPVSAMAGIDDSSVSDEGLEAWAKWTSGPCDTERLAGDHFFHAGQSQEALLKRISDALLM